MFKNKPLPFFLLFLPFSFHVKVHFVPLTADVAVMTSAVCHVLMQHGLQVLGYEAIERWGQPNVFVAPGTSLYRTHKWFLTSR
jgi:hypothetical protein